MVRSCHRCGAELSGQASESTFCPACGAPQLRVLEENVTAAAEAAATTGSLPPPNPNRIVWSAAVAASALVAGIGAVLTLAMLWLPNLFPFVWLWTVGGAVLVLALYQRRHPQTHIDARAGARVGFVYALLTFIALALVLAASAAVARFRLHSMGPVDAWLANVLHQAVAQQQLQQAASPNLPAITPEQLRIFYSPEVRAGLALFLLSVIGVFLVVFSTLGGALGGLIRPRRR